MACEAKLDSGAWSFLFHLDYVSIGEMFVLLTGMAQLRPTHWTRTCMKTIAAIKVTAVTRPNTVTQTVTEGVAEAKEAAVQKADDNTAEDQKAEGTKTEAEKAAVENAAAEDAALDIRQNTEEIMRTAEEPRTDEYIVYVDAAPREATEQRLVERQNYESARTGRAVGIDQEEA